MTEVFKCQVYVQYDERLNELHRNFNGYGCSLVPLQILYFVND